MYSTNRSGTPCTSPGPFLYTPLLSLPFFLPFFLALSPPVTVPSRLSVWLTDRNCASNAPNRSILCARRTCPNTTSIRPGARGRNCGKPTRNGPWWRRSKRTQCRLTFAISSSLSTADVRRPPRTLNECRRRRNAQRSV